MVSAEGACAAYYQYRRDTVKNVMMCPVPLVSTDQILLGHGSGGKLSADLIESIFLPAFRNPVLERLDDQAW